MPASGESTMLRKAIYATLIVILTMGAASAGNNPRELEDTKAGENSWRTELEKKNDREIDRAYQSTIKRLPDTEKKKSDPWGDVRPDPAAGAKNKQ